MSRPPALCPHWGCSRSCTATRKLLAQGLNCNAGGGSSATDSIEYRLHGSPLWETLVPAVQPPRPGSGGAGRLSDRPDGHDPRDQYVGHRRIDTGVVDTTKLSIAQVRFNCIRVTKAADPADGVYLRQFSLHKKVVPWSS